MQHCNYSILHQSVPDRVSFVQRHRSNGHKRACSKAPNYLKVKNSEHTKGQLAVAHVNGIQPSRLQWKKSPKVVRRTTKSHASRPTATVAQETVPRARPSRTSVLRTEKPRGREERGRGTPTVQTPRALSPSHPLISSNPCSRHAKSTTKTIRDEQWLELNIGSVY